MNQLATVMAFQAEGSMYDIWAMASGRVWKEQILQRGKENEGGKSKHRQTKASTVQEKKKFKLYP